MYFIIKATKARQVTNWQVGNVAMHHVDVKASGHDNGQADASNNTIKQ